MSSATSQRRPPNSTALRQPFKPKRTRTPSPLCRKSAESFVLQCTKSDSIPNEVTFADFVASPDVGDECIKNVANRSAGRWTLRRKSGNWPPPTRRSSVKPTQDHYKRVTSGSLNEFCALAAYTVQLQKPVKPRRESAISGGTGPSASRPAVRNEGFLR